MAFATDPITATGRARRTRVYEEALASVRLEGFDLDEQTKAVSPIRSRVLDAARVLSPQQFTKVLEQQHELKRIDRGRIEVEVLIKPAGSVVDCVDQNRAHSHDPGSFCDARQCIEQERFSQSLPVISIVNGKAGQQHDSDGMIRESFGNSFGALVLLDRTRRESVIANDPIVRERHVNFRRASLLVVPSKLLEPNGQDRIAAVETRHLVFPAQFLNFEFGARGRPHGRRFATCFSENSRLNRGLSCGGRSSASIKSFQCLSSSTNRVCSDSVCSAFSQALRMMKSVMFTP